ncbi:phosphatidylinositol 3-kinase regulatory subunit alpha-like [Ruditapes philippinarum]|uniref:phosphatidylinositol 3-kinase regulatory subunit alpha-like n=1 Tax=Ruditapes philippinarum TaxID=129788 RepID=UPI00295B86E4|nr:phosphatidylinositol 3-kinase regulatory subunit alpha-like [Ruditapes philippinarum]
MSDRNSYATAWDWGECTKDYVDTFLTSEPDGTFLVFKTKGSTGFTLAIRINGKNKFVEILHEDDLFGFSEPLGFESLNDVLDAYNWSPQTGNTLIYPAIRSDSPLHRTNSRSSQLSMQDLDPLTLLMDLRCAASLKMKKDERYAAIQDEHESLETKLQEVTNSLDAINILIKMIEAQIEKSKNVKFRSSIRSQASEAFESNFRELTLRLSDLNSEKRQLTETVTDIQQETNTVEKERTFIYKDMQQTTQEISTIRSTLLKRYPHLETFLDWLLNEDNQCTRNITVSSIDKSTAENMLKSSNDGTFVVRYCNTDADKPFIISVRYQGSTYHFPVLKHGDRFGLEESTCIFTSVDELVNLYSEVSLSIHNSRYGTLKLCDHLFC